ncbi:C-type lectin protein [Rhizophagus diaphanus]|nr:C-type lectin protein [Rhizophagus diaphanus] [Rhizophagus sp. MUCL 43196]
MTYSIVDIRRTEISKIWLKNSIINGLNQSTKSIPTIVLYDELGLQYFEKITYLKEYYLTDAEIDILKNKADRISDYIPEGSSVIELGSGALRKTKLILDAIEKHKKNVTYYALDLMEDELKRSLSALGEYQYIKLVGLWGTYDDGIVYTANFPEDSHKTILWMGSSIGNYNRDEAANFVKTIQDKAMNPGDLLLVGVDRRNNPDKITIAYNDPSRITEGFIMNGLNHINAIFNQPIIDRNNFEYFAKYNDGLGRHEAYYKIKNDTTLEFKASDDNPKIEIKLKKDELINIEYSYKFSKAEISDIFDFSCLSYVESWPDSQSCYDIHLVFKPPFYFKKKSDSYESVPTIEEWKELWKSTDTLMNMVDSIYDKPIEYRHPFIFYIGHIPAFLDIHLARYFKQDVTEPHNFAMIFERGIDPDIDDPDINDPKKCNPHSIVPDNWPELNSVLSFRDTVRQRLTAVYNDQKIIPRSLGRVLWMTFEHEVMHVETFLYMLIQYKNVRLPKGVIIPRWKPSYDQVPKADLITIPTQTVTLGHDDDECADDTDPLSLPFGWDNERPSRKVTVQSFKIQSRPVTNGEYLYFMKTTINKGYPSSWIPVDPSLFHYKVRTIFGPVDMNVAVNWPVMLSQEQACRYAEWTRMRLPTEEELRCFYDLHKRPDFESNVGFSYWHPTDVPHDKNVQTSGSGWEWTSTEWNTYPGFEKSKLYPGYSSDFFDGKHAVILGGSWATHPKITRRSFRNWYQRGYPFVFCSVRLCL